MYNNHKILEILLTSWQEIIQDFHVDMEKSNQIFFDIISSYSHPSRYYHNLIHIHSVLNKVEFLKTYIQDLPAVKFAAWFHDFIYDTHAQDNEEKSAEYASIFLENLGITQEIIFQVKNLILCTKNHQAYNIDSQVLLDADLSILSADPVEYQKYSQAIRQEYAWVSDTDYITGRRQVLEKFLQRPAIYSTPLMLESYEELARLNITEELKLLH
jgi:predicted metal-dependent HD superfamily phosphohydrolase